jgi:hypothetical protein
VQRRRTKFSVVAVCVGAVFALSACATGSSSHAVLGNSPGSDSASSALTQPVGENNPQGSSGSAGRTHLEAPSTVTTTPSPPLNQQTLNAVSTDLGALGKALDQASSDVDNTQGDS